MKLFTINGIEIKVHVSTLLIVGLVAFNVGTIHAQLFSSASTFDLVLVGILGGLAILGSIVLHELMHSLLAQRHGMEVQEIELYLFGGVSKITEEPKVPESEWRIALVGPLSSILLGVALLAIGFIPVSFPPVAVTLVSYFAWVNLALGGFNLLPGFPMDGGRILRAYLWKKRGNLLSATKTAAKVGKYIGYGLMGLGVLEIFLVSLLGGFWLIIMGNFLESAARSAYYQTVMDVKLREIHARDFTGRTIASIPADTPIQEAIYQYFRQYRGDFFPVTRDGETVGVVTIERVMDIPSAERQSTVVGDVAFTVEELPHVVEDATGKKIYQILQEQKEDRPQVVSVTGPEEKNVLGFVGREDLKFALKMDQFSAEMRENFSF